MRYFFGGSGSGDGARPYAALIQGTDGNFYGTTQTGGAGSNCSAAPATICGTVFKITPAGVETMLHSFSGSVGGSPYASLVQGSDGNFYGTTQTGGTVTAKDCGGVSCGTVFKLAVGGS